MSRLETGAYVGGAGVEVQSRRGVADSETTQGLVYGNLTSRNINRKVNL